jgi:hypothetical protein
MPEQRPGAKPMSVSGFFRQLGAPLRNIRWSWGAVRADGTVVLRVWDDFIETINGNRYVMVEYRPKPEPPPKDLGYWERRDHINLIRSGRPCLMVMCTAEDAGRHVPYGGSGARKIVAFDDKRIFVGGDFLEKTDKLMMRIADRKPASAFSVNC